MRGNCDIPDRLNTLDRATTLRAAISAGMFNAFNVAPLEDDNDIVVASELEECVSVIEEAYLSKSSAVFVTYANSQALKLNRAIRERLWGDEEADLRGGDLLLVNRNSMIYSLSNGDLVKVKEVDSEPERRPVRIKGVPHPVELVFRRATVVYRSADDVITQIPCQLLENLLRSPERELTPLELRALLVDFRLRNPYLRPKTEAFNVAIRNDRYFNALQVKYGYAMTCHKAQGGEWNVAIVYFGSGRGTQNEDFFRWAYTAITRTKRKLITVNAPEFRPETGIKWPERPLPRESSDNDRSSDPDWGRFCFTPGQESLFACHVVLRDAWNKAGIAVERVDHLQYLERYILVMNSTRASVQYYYKGDMKVSTIRDVPGAGSDPELLKTAVSVMKRALKSAPGQPQDLGDPFLGAFLNALSDALVGSGILVVSAEPGQYRLRVEFDESDERHRIDFFYNGRKAWTSAQEVGGTGSSKGLIERVRRLMESKA